MIIGVEISFYFEIRKLFIMKDGEIRLSLVINA